MDLNEYLCRRFFSNKNIFPVGENNFFFVIIYRDGIYHQPDWVKQNRKMTINFLFILTVGVICFALQESVLNYRNTFNDKILKFKTKQDKYLTIYDCFFFFFLKT